jgi:hypothetical protein
MEREYADWEGRQEFIYFRAWNCRSTDPAR